MERKFDEQGREVMDITEDILAQLEGKGKVPKEKVFGMGDLVLAQIGFGKYSVMEVLMELVAPNVLEGMDNLVEEEIEPFGEEVSAEEYNKFVDTIKEGISDILEQIKK